MARSGKGAVENYVRHMAFHDAKPDLTRRVSFLWLTRHLRPVLVIALAGLVFACALALESRFLGLKMEHVRVDETPVTLYRPVDATTLPLVVVAHGFGGSRQMMDQIAVSLARQGFLVAALDLPGHGRNTQRLSADVADLDGTTAQLVDVVDHVANTLVKRTDAIGPVSFVGHSMATDIVIRAAQLREDVGGVVAISMYSPAVTATAPESLLIISGATEKHLRKAGLAAVRQVSEDAREGETVARDGVTRRAAVAPFVGHVGVLYAPASLKEITGWLREAKGTDRFASLDDSGWVAGTLLVGLLLLFWPLSTFMPLKPANAQPLMSKRLFIICLIAPLPAVLLIAALPTLGIAGHATFGTLSAIFGVWGLVQLFLLRRGGIRVEAPDLPGMLVYLGCALVFALALDRYGAAFLPTDMRAVVMFGLLIGTLPMMLADTLLVENAPLLRRLLVRLSFLVALSSAMALAPKELGLAFTTLPVMVLFFVVYGSMARWIAARRGATGVAIGKAIFLAWSIAASTPLFAVTGLS
ncbi:MAG: alpha/beta hydrolase [Arenibacterium sp.]